MKGNLGSNSDSFEGLIKPISSGLIVGIIVIALFFVLFAFAMSFYILPTDSAAITGSISMAIGAFAGGFVAAKKLTHRFSQRLNRAGRCLLDKNIARLSMLECEQNKVYSFVKRHYKASHALVCYGDSLSCLYLLNPKRNNRAARAHNVSVTGTADFRFFR